MRIKRSNGSWRRWSLVLVLSISGCATPPAGSSYRVQIPELHVLPTYQPCSLQKTGTSQPEETECVTLLAEDYHNLVIELKAACLGLGQSEVACQVGGARHDAP